MLLEPQDPLDLGQLGVGVLQHGRAPDEHVDPDPVAGRHLVDEPTEIPLQLGDAGIELVAAALEIDGAASALGWSKGPFGTLPTPWTRRPPTPWIERGLSSARRSCR